MHMFIPIHVMLLDIHTNEIALGLHHKVVN
jgi:hypothetical protein